jgi:sulfite reductase (ferredoxin)
MTSRRRKNAFEQIKEQGNGLRGTIAQELATDSLGFTPDNVRLLKYHGVFQQDNRSERSRQRELGGERRYEFMVRIRATGGWLSASQILGIVEIAERWGDGTVRLTSRQGMQIRGIGKADLKPALRWIAELGLTTLATAGDLNCNVMCCPATPQHVDIQRQLQAIAENVCHGLMPRVAAYEEIWLNGQSAHPHPIRKAPVGARYGETLLPHKFKVAIATPDDNCADIYSQDVGLLAVVDGQRVVGFNVLVGGGMGTILGVSRRFPALARPLAYVECGDVLPLVAAIVDTYRQCGDRTDRSKARLKYLIHRWGLARFQQQVEERFGRALDPPRQLDVVGCEDHLGWQRQSDGNWCLGIHVDSGLVRDTCQVRLKSALAHLARMLGDCVRLTPQQNIIFSNISPQRRGDVDALLAEHDVPPVESLSNVRRHAMACPGLPHCPSAITESVRVLPGIIAAFEAEVSRLGLSDERFTVRVTGCPFGCTRSYLADIALVGRTVDPETGQEKYAIFLGGEGLGRRLNTLYLDLVPADQIMPTLGPLLTSTSNTAIRVSHSVTIANAEPPCPVQNTPITNEETCDERASYTRLCTVRITTRVCCNRAAGGLGDSNRGDNILWPGSGAASVDRFRWRPLDMVFVGG